MFKCTLFVYIIIQLAPFVNPQKKVANVTTFNPFLSRGTYLSSVGFITVPSNTPRRQKKSANGTLVWRRERDSNPCEIALKRFSRPPRYDHFDIPPYKRNYEIILEKTLEEKTLLSEKCVCFPQIRGFFADCFRYGKEVSRLPCYDRRSLSTNTEISFRI